MEYSAIINVLTLLALVSYGEAVRCWTCSSDLDPDCGDTFNHTSRHFSLHHTLTDCNTQASPTYPFLKSMSVCKKLKQKVNNELVVVRSCAWLKGDEEAGTCPTPTTPSYITIEFCETCNTDSCNSAEGLHSIIFWKTLIPVAVALYLRK